jgi:DNA-binding GntR family transcriptional regulator
LSDGNYESLLDEALHISWSSPHFASHFVSLRYVSSIPNVIFLSGLVQSEDVEIWLEYAPKYGPPKCENEEKSSLLILDSGDERMSSPELLDAQPSHEDSTIDLQTVAEEHENYLKTLTFDSKDELVEYVQSYYKSRAGLILKKGKHSDNRKVTLFV